MVKNNNDYFLLSVNVNDALLISNIYPGYLVKSGTLEMHCGCWGSSKMHYSDMLLKIRNAFV